MKSILTSLFAVVLAAGCLALDATAAELRAGISTREAYVGMPITMQIQVSNATKHEPPTMPEIPGLRIESLGQPSQSSNVSWINGTVTKNVSVIYSFAVTPTRPGTFQIPAINVHADGETLTTRPFDFVASKSETGDLLFVELEGKEKQIYVGQALDMTLNVWVRPYRDQELGITLSEGDMWQLLSQRTHWGPFQEQIEQLAENNQRPVGVEVLRKDREGESHSYYHYVIEGTIYPKKPGRIDANDVQVVVLYPTAIGQSRDPFERMFEDMGMPGGRRGMFGGGLSMFGPRLQIESVRPIVAEVKVEPIEVLDVPIADRPADYRGAVGKYRIASTAMEKDVQAGDPINLILAVTGTGPLDLVQAPPLAQLSSLTANFKVSNEPLAGYVQGERKLFQTTIRPRKAGITEIPPIPFTYFDPEIGKFVTTQSEPITIHVAPAETLALADVVGRSHGSAAGGDAATAAARDNGPQLMNFTGNELLSQQTPATPISPTAVAFLALPPIAVLLLALFRGRSGLASLKFLLGTSIRRCEARIAAATRPAEVAEALSSLLRRRFSLGADADAEALVGALRAAGYRTVAVRCERIFQQCEAAGAVNGGASLAHLQREANDVIHELQSTRRPARLKPVRPLTASRLRTTSAIVALALAGALFATGQQVQAATLDENQQQALLAEANTIYSTALADAAKDSADAKEAFAEAAAKYQLITDAGVENGRLYFNLANAYLQSGETGRAIANYRRAIRLDSTNRAAHVNLAYAERLLTRPDSDSQSRQLHWTELAAAANGWINRFVSPGTVLATAIAGWIVLWCAIGLRLLAVRLPWKSLAACSLLVCVAAAASYATTCRTTAWPEAVVVAADAKLRTGDGENFPAAGATLHEGQSLKWLKRRGDWVQVRGDAGETGWVPGRTIEIL